MKTLALLLAMLGQAGQQDPQTPPDPNVQQYQNIFLQLKFSCPKAWELTTNKKGESRILIPIENTSDRAVVEVLPVSFRSDPDVWQLSEVGINKTMKRTVERQWQEEILGVPLLLTKVSYDDKGSQKTSETGLIYSLGFSKMMYRITASPASFDKVDYEWRQVLQTLRTWDGSMPSAENPSVKIDRKVAVPDALKKDDIPHPTIPHEINALPKTKLLKSPVGASLQVGDKKLDLHIPGGWKVDSDKQGGFILHNAALSGPLTVTVAASAGTDSANIALYKASGVSLQDFTKVAVRDESLPRPNKAGTSIAKIWRSGTSAKGDLYTCEACGDCGEYYFLVSYRADNASRWASDRRAIDELLDRMSLEPAP